MRDSFIKKALSRRLLRSAEDANVHSIGLMLNTGADQNVKNDDGDTLIMLLCGHYVAESVPDSDFETSIDNVLKGLRIIYEAGGDLAVKNKLKQSALFHAVSNPCAGPLIWLLNNNVHFDINAQDIYGNTCLHWRPFTQNELNMFPACEPIMALLVFGIDTSIMNNDGEKPRIFCLEDSSDHVHVLENKCHIHRYSRTIEFFNIGALRDNELSHLQRAYEAEAEELKKIQLSPYKTVYDVLYCTLPQMLRVLNNVIFKELHYFSESFYYFGVFLNAKIFHGKRRLIYHDKFKKSFQLLLGKKIIDDIFEIICKYFSNVELKRLTECNFTEYL